MTKCRNEKPLEKGTRVYIPATIVGIMPKGAEGGVGVHNIVVDTEHFENEGSNLQRKTTINLHSSQVISADSLNGNPGMDPQTAWGVVEQERLARQAADDKAAMDLAAEESAKFTKPKGK